MKELMNEETQELIKEESKLQLLVKKAEEIIELVNFFTIICIRSFALFD
jgi:hypothetical protein